MNYQTTMVAQATESARAEFYRKTYAHVAMAILAFIGVESLLIKFIPEEMIFSMISGRFVWLFILGLFWLGTSMSNRFVFDPSREKQYLGLGLYVVLEAIIFLPLIAMATYYSGGGMIMQEIGRAHV